MLDIYIEDVGVFYLTVFYVTIIYLFFFVWEIDIAFIKIQHKLFSMID